MAKQESNAPKQESKTDPLLEKLQAENAELKAQLAADKPARPTIEGGVIKGTGVLGPADADGNRKPIKCKDCEVWERGSNEKIIVKNVADESEAVRLFKLSKGLGPKASCRAAIVT